MTNNHSFNSDLTYNDAKVRTEVILETSFTKEIRILLKKGQAMREHKAPFPIIVHLLEGSIDFGIEGETHKLTKGAILTLSGNVPHDLLAHEDSVVRLSLSKLDKPERVEDVAQKS
ncbi:cupin [Cryomorpha ignava]|uniref:Cupin n=1 Tax=Cryomorpha ignava TaxID=101383 RepID=A0A7K3WL54_9FLAO|nr:cupin domain-containing protein [Cryomorpha ignava]NEN22258.1 cupin [Cryomorpha ignava]